MAPTDNKGIKIERPARAEVSREEALRRMETFPERASKMIAAIKAAQVRGSRFSFVVKLDREANGRWIAEVGEIPGALAYGRTQKEAFAKVASLVMRAIADRLEHGEIAVDLVSVSFARV